jgi:uncharacterized surface protein with fasciclin (FAS1) repeats
VLAVEVAGDRISVGGATIVEADLEASNGLVHAVDAVIVPAIMRERVLGPGSS